MSGGITPLGPLPPSSYGTLGELVAASNTVQTQLDTLAQQASSGNVSSTYAGLGANALASLNLNAEIAQNNTYVSNITAANTNIGVTQTVMNQLSSIASNISSQLDNITPGSVDTLAAQAQSDLVQVASLLDTQNGTNYVFAGQDATNPPVPDPTNILNSGFFTQINTAVGQLATNGAATTIATTLGIASSNAAGTSPFSPALSQAASALQGFQPSVATGPGESTTAGLLASANTFVTSSGAYTTGSYMRDLMHGLAVIGSLSNAQQNLPAFSTLLGDVQTSLSDAGSTMANEEGALGATQDSLSATSTTLGDVNTALQTQVSSIQDVNMARTLSNLSMVQTQMQASFKLIASMQNMSLVSYV